MDRDKKLYTCIASLYNISQDIKDENSFISDLVLFAADQLMKYRDNTTGDEKCECGGECQGPHKEGKIHSTRCQCENKQEKLSPEEEMIASEVIETLSEVKAEIDGEKAL
jgi:hypothetical protein